MATVVLLSTLVACIIWMPRTVIAGTAKDAISAALYVENLKLVAASTNYFDAGKVANPVQHYWTLSVEEQFYILWPILIALSFFVMRKLGGIKAVLLSTIGLVFLTSLTFSISATKSEAARAYFTTTTRMWELAIGGIVAVLLYNNWNPSIIFSRLLSWLGLIFIALSMFLYDTQTPFPSYRALLPTLGTAFIIYAATDGISFSPRYILCWKPNQIIGDLSYSIYLWHWPVLLIAPFAMNSDLNLRSKTVLLFFVVALSYFSKRYIEDTLRNSIFLINSNIRTFIFGAICIALVVVLSVSIVKWNSNLIAREDKKLTKLSTQQDRCFGAAAIRNKDCDIHGKELLMSPSYARADKNQLDSDGCYSYPPYSSQPVCNYGKKTSPIKVALLGNSHAGMLLSPVLKTVNKHGWQLDTYTILLCYNVNMKLVFPTDDEAESQNCLDWNNWALDTISKSDYDLVVISNSTGIPIKGVPDKDKNAVAQQEYKATIQRLVNAHKTVLIVRDTPDGITYAPECISANLNNVSDCDNPRSEALKPDPLFDAALEFNSKSVKTLDLTNRFCDDKTCYVTIGGVIVYWDQKHMTNTFSKTLYPEISASLESILKTDKQ